MRHLREIFDDTWTRGAGIILALVIALMVFNLFSGFTHSHPMVALLAFSLVPVLFVLGGIVFVVSLIRIFRQRNG